jgi:hypothetical protein
MSEDKVWSEVKIGSEGISVSLYSEDEDGHTVVEDEFWLTHDELSDESNHGTYSLEQS